MKHQYIYFISAKASDLANQDNFYLKPIGYKFLSVLRRTHIHTNALLLAIITIYD